MSEVKPERVMSMWTVYCRPRDYPRHYVARRSEIRRNKALGSNVVPTADVRVAPTLEQIRELIPPGLYRLDRMPGDAPHIVEVWM